jgi:tRNA (cmo5U34)-methyltransferase
MRRHVTQPGCQITAVDLSHPMIERARAHLSGFKSEVPVELVEADICDIAIENASVVVLNFTLQFVAPEKGRPSRASLTACAPAASSS